MGNTRTYPQGSCEAWKVKVKSLSCVRLFATPWTVAYQAPPSMGFSRQEWVVISFSRGSSRPRYQTRVSCIGVRRFKLWATRGAHTLDNMATGLRTGPGGCKASAWEISALLSLITWPLRWAEFLRSVSLPCLSVLLAVSFILSSP